MIPDDIEKGNVITASWLNSVKAAILSDIRGGQGIDITRQGTNVTVALSRPTTVNPVSEFWAKIVDSVSGFHANSYKYGWLEHTRNSASGWVQTTNGRQGTTVSGYALNSLEYYNTGTGTQGNSIDHSSTNYPSGYKLLPASGNPIVRMYEESLPDSSLAYSFQYENAEDGAC